MPLAEGTRFVTINDAQPAWLPPHVRLLGLVAAKWFSQPIYALAKLNIADLLADGPRPVSDLAAAAGVHPDPLRRCLRAAAAVGVFEEDADGRFGLTDMGNCLRSDEATSLRDLAVLLGEEPMWQSFGDLLETVHGVEMFDYLAEHPDLSQVYQGAWATLTSGLAAAAVQDFDFGRFGHVADLGGGHGRLLTTLLRAHPQMTGTLFDRPDVLAHVGPVLAGEGFGERLRLVPGLLPGTRPPAADAYVLKNILHCFDDAASHEMLRAVREAIGERPGRLLIIEAVPAPGDLLDWGKLMDIEVMVNHGGRVRTEREWRDLLADCGFTLCGSVPTTPPHWILEAAPAGLTPGE
jgi:hypothetical protein